VTGEPFVLELGESRPSLLDLVVRDRPVDLVEVDCAKTKSRETPLELASERVALQALQGRPVRPFGLAAFREDKGLVAGVGVDGPADDLLGVAETVLRRSIDPVDA
jgi:hypothetical protein